jgi:hypothetical protein
MPRASANRPRIYGPGGGVVYRDADGLRWRFYANQDVRPVYYTFGGSIAGGWSYRSRCGICLFWVTRPYDGARTTKIVLAAEPGERRSLRNQYLIGYETASDVPPRDRPATATFGARALAAHLLQVKAWARAMIDDRHDAARLALEAALCDSQRNLIEEVTSAYATEFF